MQDMRNVYQSTQIDLNDDDMEVELATPWQRIGAYLINILIGGVLYLPMVFGVAIPAYQNSVAQAQGLPVAADGGMSTGSAVMMGISGLLLLAYLIYQAVIMSRDGQSLGKKIMKIKVVDLDGYNPGFKGVVLMREIVFNIITSVLSLIPFLGVLVSFGVSIARLVMIFLDSNDRRTLQDMLAKTMVVKA